MNANGHPVFGVSLLKYDNNAEQGGQLQNDKI